MLLNCMSDTRFTLGGIVLIFSGFLILGIYGSNFSQISIQSEEFEECYEYHGDGAPSVKPCEEGLKNRTWFFVMVIGLIVGGILALLKGLKGRWDQDVKPQDMVGPG